MIRRKPADDDDDNHERWLVSYADFITLLFAFFVVMYAISSVNQNKYEQLTSSMGSAFMGKDGQIIQINKGSATDSSQQKSLIKPLPLSHIYAEKARKEREAMQKVGVDLSVKLSTLTSDNKVNVWQNSRGVRIDINDTLLFDAGSANLSERATPILREVAAILKTTPYAIQVEGHTDNTPIHSDLFYSNWELSALRASSVVRMLSSLEVAENRLSATGFGATKPISENETAEGRSKNRRVSIMVLHGTKNPLDDEMPITAATKIEQ